MDSSLLPAPEPPPRPAPKRALSLLFVPAAALAGGVLFQRLFDLQGGDAMLHWLLFSSAAGVVAGGVIGLWLGSPILWTFYGAAAPWVVAGIVTVGVRAARPVRDLVAARSASECRASGRALCTLSEFRAACEVGARARLGTPQHEACSASGCTRRWSYTGPWTPDNFVAPGAVLCSVVTDGQGRVVRQTVLAGSDPG